MGISLSKGQRISLEKVAPGLEAVMIGLGWDFKKVDTGSQYDIDVSIFMLNEQGKIPTDEHFIFYNNLKSPDPDHAVEHLGDNRTGVGEGDDEVILVNLKKIPANIQKLVFVVTIHEAEQRGQNFGQIYNAFIRLVDVQNKTEVLRYDLTEDYSIETALIPAELYLKDGEWRMNAVGSGYQGGLAALLDRYA